MFTERNDINVNDTITARTLNITVILTELYQLHVKLKLIHLYTLYP